MPKFDAVVSQVVLDEISGGDPDFAAKRIASVAGMNVLELTEEAVTLAREYFAAIALPEAARADSLHLALATSHGMDYLTSWNCRHIASARVRQIVEKINDARGLATPVICTPEELLEF